MSSTWGAVSNHYRLGIEVIQTPASITAGTSIVTLTVKVWGQSVGWGHNWTNTLSFGGAWSGSKPVQFYSPTGETVTKLLHTATVQVYPSFTGSTARTFTASVNGYGASSVSHTHNVGRRPYSSPRPPLSPAAEYVADGRARISWRGNYDGANGSQPWDGVKILRWSTLDPQWRPITQLHWSVTSFEDTSAPLNAQVKYVVVSYNSSGDSVWAQAGTVNQRPAAPTNVAAAKRGSDVIVSWSNSYPEDYVSGFKIYDNGAYIATVTNGAATSWVHQNASTSVTHRYEVAALTRSPELESGKSLPSNTVQLLAPPLAPALKSPSGFVEKGTQVLKWVHSPVDSSEQTKAEIRYRAKGTGWSTRTISGSTQELALSFPVGVFEWQVRTWGAYKNTSESGASSWSATSSFEAVDLPVVQLLTPTSQVRTSKLEANWSFYQAQKATQSAVQLALMQDEDPVHETTIHGNSTTFNFPITLNDGENYRLAIRVRSGHGLWSKWTFQTFSVRFPLPPQPHCETSWDDSLGAMVLNITNPKPGANNVETVTNDVYRSVDNGQTWELVQEGCSTNTSLSDYESLSWGKTLYRIIANSSLPSSVTLQIEVKASSHSIWIGGRKGYSQQIRLPYNPKISFQPRLTSRKVIHFAGRKHGVELSGTGHQLTGSISSLIIEDDPTAKCSSASEVEHFAYETGPFLYRDQSGRRIYCSLQDVQISRNHLARWQFSAKIEEISRE